MGPLKCADGTVLAQLHVLNWVCLFLRELLGLHSGFRNIDFLKWLDSRF